MSSELRFDALGTRWIIELPIAPETKLQSRLTQLVAEFQANYTRFKSNSLLGTLNDTKQLQNPPEEMVNMLEYAVDMYKKSHGVFNISVGSRLEKDGYGMKPDQNSVVSRNLLSDVHVTKSKIQIAEHIRLDFGGFGKGWLVDRVHRMLVEKGLEDHVINAGGDIRVGCEPKTIYVESPVEPQGSILGTITMRNESFAASSNRKRRWQTINGIQKAHIVHPISDETNLSSLQVCTRSTSCLAADTAATTLFLSPLNEYDSLAKMFGVEYLVVTDDLVQQSEGFCLDQNPNSSR